jgi:hypothetical protein
MVSAETTQIVELLIALIAAIIAWWQMQQKKDAQNDLKQTVAFYDPKDQTVTSANDLPPEVVLPGRSYLMDESTKRWITVGETAEDQQTILNQVAAAETNGLAQYRVLYSKGWYVIEYGLIKESGRGEK